MTFRAHTARAALAALIAGLLLALPGLAFAGTFGQPFRIAPPTSVDLQPVQLAFGPTGAIAAAFGTVDEDNPASASALLTQRPPAGAFGRPRTVSAAQRILSLAYRGGSLELLTGDSPSTLQCCSAALVAPVSGGRVGTRHTLITGLAGATQGVLVPAARRLLAVVATEQGVWVAQTDTKGRWGSTRSLTAGAAAGWPQQIAATALPGGRTLVVWTARASQFAPGPVNIYLAAGDAAGPPSHAHVTIAVQPTHTIDELALAARGGVPTLAWIESWYDPAGKYHSQAYAEDLNATRVPQLLSSASELASGIALAGAGDTELVAFRGCSAAGQCVLRAALRRSGRFHAAPSLGEADGDQSPAVAVGSSGAALAGWVSGGGVRAALAAPGAASLSAPVTVSGTGFASDLTLAFAPTGGAALAAWTQGTLQQSIMGARYTP